MGVRLALILEYEGTGYSGFQIQRESPTVQAEIERALERVTGEGIRIKAASRTDAGVHAQGQVVAFTTSWKLSGEVLVRALNHYLPDDIVARAAFRTRDDFDPRRDARSREYRYTILNDAQPSPFWRRYACLVARPLDVEAMSQASQVLIGEHDFRPFVAAWVSREKNTTRTVYQAEITRQGNLVMFDMMADSFLPHQVRRTIGPLIQVGTGKLSVAAFCELAQSNKLDAAQPAAPAHGLCLMRVNYSEEIAAGVV